MFRRTLGLSWRCAGSDAREPRSGAISVLTKERHGCKTWMAVYSNGDAKQLLSARPPLDRGASQQLAAKLFPSESLEPLEDGSLSFTNPADDELLVGCFPGVSVVAAKEYAIDYPSRLPAELASPALGRVVHLHAMHSVVDWFAFAVWHDGALVRALSLSPDSGVMEDVGARQPFEIPYWEGLHPAVDPGDDPDDYPLPFHPLDLGEAALLEFFGYQLEGSIDPTHLDPEDIPLMQFKRSKSRSARQSRPWWKLW